MVARNCPEQSLDADRSRVQSLEAKISQRSQFVGEHPEEGTGTTQERAISKRKSEARVCVCCIGVNGPIDPSVIEANPGVLSAGRAHARASADWCSKRQACTRRATERPRPPSQVKSEPGTAGSDRRSRSRRRRRRRNTRRKMGTSFRL